MKTSTELSLWGDTTCVCVHIDTRGHKQGQGPTPTRMYLHVCVYVYMLAYTCVYMSAGVSVCSHHSQNVVILHD